MTRTLGHWNGAGCGPGFIKVSKKKRGKFESKMSSAEPTVYGKDLAIRVVWQGLGMELTFREIAKHLQIGIGTAYRLYNRYVVTGEFSPDLFIKKHPLHSPWVRSTWSVLQM